MAVTTATETMVVQTAGSTPALIKVYGNVVDSASAGTIVIQPGVAVAGSYVPFGTASIGLRKMLAWGFTDSSNKKEVQAVKSFDNVTNYADILTVTFNAGDSLDFWVEGYDEGIPA